jgi:hypothetical protein
MAIVSLTQGQVAFVDDDDLKRVNEHLWHAKWNKDTQSFYARTSIRVAKGRQRTVELHRFIMHEPNGMWIIHRNGDALDCRKENLRPATAVESGRNRGKHRDNTTGFLGVTKRKNRYHAQLYVNGKNKMLGSFKTAVEAALVRDVASRRYFGEFARLNFPDTNDVSVKRITRRIE